MIVSINIDKEINLNLKDEAKKNLMSKSKFIEKIVRAYFEQRK